MPVKLVVFGADGPTGRLAVEQALAAGHDVAAVTRKPDQYPLRSAALDVVAADVADPDGVDRAVAGAEVLLPLLRKVVGRTLYDDMERMEQIVRGSGLKWTIVRPGGLFDTAAPTADYEVSTGQLSGRLTSRADLAATLIREAVAPQHPRSVIEVVTRSQTPSPVQFFRDAFGIGRRTAAR